jgi:hypothetical protein
MLGVNGEKRNRFGAERFAVPIFFITLHNIIGARRFRDIFDQG